MSTPTEGLMKLIALTKQKRDIGPMLQEFVCRKYGVENMAAFTRGAVPGVADKEALYLQWFDWINSGELHHFAEPEPLPLENDDDLLAAMLTDDSSDEAATLSQNAIEHGEDDLDALAALVGEDLYSPTQEISAPEPEGEWDIEPEPDRPVLETESNNDALPLEPDETGFEATDSFATEETEAPDLVEPVEAVDDCVETAPPQPTAAFNSIDSLVLGLIRRELAALPEPEQAISEERIREIVREELRSVLRSALG